MSANVPMEKQYLVMYRDNSARMYAGMCWNAYTFRSWQERDEMVADLNNPESAWGGEAVTIVTTEIMVPLVAVLPGGEDDDSMDFSSFDGMLP